MKIFEVTAKKREYLDLLLLADEQENMIERYIDRGAMYVLDDRGVKAVCVVTDEGGGVAEIKNIAVLPHFQRMGYGRRMVEFVKISAAENTGYCAQAQATARSPFRFTKHAGSGEHIRSKIFLWITMIIPYMKRAFSLKTWYIFS